MNGADAERWSQAAAGWAAHWGGFTEPVRTTLIDGAAVRPGDRVLEVGCGSGEFLRTLTAMGADAVGIDPAPGMVDLARNTVPAATVGIGDFGRLPWPDDTFDIVFAVNALQFADDMTLALREAARVVRPGGRIGIANWADARLSDLDAVETVLAVADGSDAGEEEDEDYRCAGGLERLMEASELAVTKAGSVSVPWVAPDDDTLVQAILLGESPSRIEAIHDTVVEAATPFRTADGYVLQNTFRFAVGVTPRRGG